MTERHLLPKTHKYYREPVTIKTPFGDFQHAGLFFDAPELLEFSSATIPMNPQALQRNFADRIQRANPASISIAQLIAAIKGATTEQLRELNAALVVASNPDEDFAAEVLRHLKGKKT